tara:strand:- start:230 stop:715 length:486 start_codon:yes stop_codon:yes gene_type:complete
MIITCPNCNKQFQIDNSLIPDDGRDLQCGSCNNVWFFKAEYENEAPLKLDENIPESKPEKEKEIKNESPKFSKKLSQEKISKTEKKKEITKEIPENIKKSSNRVTKFFSYLIVFIISFVALIILLDTLKTPVINVFPGLEVLLFNLFETLQDIKLFIIDLT